MNLRIDAIPRRATGRLRVDPDPPRREGMFDRGPDVEEDYATEHPSKTMNRLMLAESEHDHRGRWATASESAGPLVVPQALDGRVHH
jgi:hypothetical protein